MLLLVANIVGSKLATAEEMDPASRHLVMSAADASVSGDLSSILADGPRPAIENAFWNDAIGILRSSIGDEATGRAIVARLMEAALIQSGIDPDTTPLDILSKGDIISMREAIGLPDGGDLLIYLLNRGPSLREDFGLETYTAIRFVVEGLGVRVVFERADLPYLGVGTTFESRIVEEEDDPVSVSQGQRAITRRLNLASLPRLVLAAKAYRAAKRLSENAKEDVYPLLIAADSMNEAFHRDASDDLRTAWYNAEWKALEALRVYEGQDPFLLYEKEHIAFKAPRVFFFFRLFEVAATSYSMAPVAETDVRGKVWAAWGEGISLFAYGESAGPAFEGVTEGVGRETAEYAKMLELLLRYSTADERQAFGDVSAWEGRIENVVREMDQRSLESFVERDFRVIMETIGRPDIAARFLMDRIRSDDNFDREYDYLRWLTSYIVDYCDIISFRLSGDGSWIRRETLGYDALLDFLDSFSEEEGRFVRAGEVVISDGSYEPYSALSPEEDCATAQAVYGVVDNQIFGDIGEWTVESGRSGTVAGIEGWVRQAMSRTDPAPSIVPYLKLVWLEWFGQSFESLKNSSVGAGKFMYDPIDASSLTEPERVRDLKQHPGATEHQKHLVDLFLDTREFLQTRYGS